MVEQRPRAQSRGIARTVEQGHGLIFTTRERPVKSTRGWARGPVRHGVSNIRSGIRHTLGRLPRRRVTYSWDDTEWRGPIR
jgi:hypothetical protein